MFSGHNDNNLNRRYVPSNNYPPPSSGNPFNRFNSSTNTKQYNNFDQAYNGVPTMIDPINYANQNNLIHNNVGDSVLNESIVDYYLNIDSLDRDIKTYLNPFNFTVKFNTIAGGTMQTIEKGQIKSTYFPSAPGPLINKEFRNIKYIKLDSIVLPQYSDIIYCSSEHKNIFNPDSYLVDDRFVTLEIDEITDCNRVYSSSDNGVRVDPITNQSIVPPKPFGIIFPDTKFGKHYYSGVPYNASKIYKSTDLGNIKRLTIKLYDSMGVPLNYDNLYTYDQLQTAAKAGHPISTCDLRHPLNKNIQLHMSFVVGVVEGHVNNNTKFER